MILCFKHCVRNIVLVCILLDMVKRFWLLLLSLIVGRQRCIIMVGQTIRTLSVMLLMSCMHRFWKTRHKQGTSGTTGSVLHRSRTKTQQENGLCRLKREPSLLLPKRQPHNGVLRHTIFLKLHISKSAFRAKVFSTSALLNMFFALFVFEFFCFSKK